MSKQMPLAKGMSQKSAPLSTTAAAIPPSASPSPSPSPSSSKKPVVAVRPQQSSLATAAPSGGTSSSRQRAQNSVLPRSAFDPLRPIESWNEFWNTVDTHFMPITMEDIAFVRSLPSDRYGGARDSHLRLPSSSPVTDGTDPVLNSYPYTQRLVAALLDEGKAPVPAPPSSRASRAAGAGPVAADETAPAASARHAEELERNVISELQAVGLVDVNTSEPLAISTRAAQWRLCAVKEGNVMRRAALANTAAVKEARSQGARREVRRKADSLQMAYLEKMLGNARKNKKSRAKFSKLLARYFGHYKAHEQKLAAASTSSALLNAKKDGGDGDSKVPRAKGGVRKKKRKSEASKLVDALPPAMAAHLTHVPPQLPPPPPKAPPPKAPPPSIAMEASASVHEFNAQSTSKADGAKSVRRS